VTESCDEIQKISLSYQHAYEIIKQLSFDILIFADLVSEPINHFMALQRLAPIQVTYHTSSSIIIILLLCILLLHLDGILG